MRTEKRITKLQEAVSFVAKDFDRRIIVSDIATDHGYLAESLSKQDFVNKVIATDISEKCLSKLVKLIKQRNLSKIETIVGDGLIPIEKADISVVAGIGGFEIIKMLKNQNKTSAGENKCNIFVLQPAQNALELREWIFDNKLFLIKDYVIEDAERFYPIIIVDVSKNQVNEKSIFNLWIGRDNTIESKDFMKYLKDALEYLKFLDELPKERIESDKVLRDKSKLKLIIEKMLKE